MNRIIFPFPAYPLSGDIETFAGSNQVRVIGLEDVPLDPVTVGSPAVYPAIINYSPLIGAYVATDVAGGGGGSGGGFNGVKQISTNYPVTALDSGYLLSCTGPITVTLLNPAPVLTPPWWVYIESVASTTIVNPNGLNIDGSSGNITLNAGQGIFIGTDGTNYFTERGWTTKVHKVGFTLSNGGSAITTGYCGSIQVNFAGTITGWSIEADQSGSISIDVVKHAGTQTVPVVPNTTSDKISASAPIVLSSQQAAGIGASGLTGWTTNVAQYDSIGFNITAASTVTFAAGWITIQE